MILKGKEIAKKIIDELRSRRTTWNRSVTLGMIVAGADPVIESFVNMKKKIADELDVSINRLDLGQNTGTADIIEAVQRLSQTTDGLIVQLPLPVEVDVNAALSAIPVRKDVDGINPIYSEHERIAPSPVARAIERILSMHAIDAAGKRAVIVGAGRLVGSPSGALLKRLGADVSHVTLDEGDISDVKEADILVLGAGNPGMIKPEHIKEGVVLLDAGTSEIAGVLKGDADPACAPKASIFTPVPGGIGPIAVTLIFENLFDLIDVPQR